MPKSTTFATLVLLGVSKKGGCSPSPRSTGNLVHDHLVPRPLPGSTFVPTGTWIRNVFWPSVRWPLTLVQERLETGRPSLYKAVNTELPRYLGLVGKVAIKDGNG